MDSSTPQKINVKSIISIFENQSVNNFKNESNNLVRKTKSMGNLTHILKPQVRVYTNTVQKTPEKNLELVQIAQQVEHLQKKIINNYSNYSRESHIYYQNQIIFLLCDLSNVNTLTETKSELCESLKRLNKKINTLLPSTSPDSVENVDVDARRKSPMVKSKSVDERREQFQAQKSKSELDDDSSALSVRTLKEMFEKNSKENEAKVGVNPVRKVQSFNAFKYVTYSEKLKKENSVEIEERQEVPEEKRNGEIHEEKQNGEISPDSLSGTEGKNKIR